MKPWREVFEALQEVAAFQHRPIAEQNDSVTEAVDIEGHVKKIARMTDENQHPEAIVYFTTEVLKDRKLAAMAKAALDLQIAFGELTPGLRQVRDDLWKRVEATAKSKLSPEDYKKLMQVF